MKSVAANALRGLFVFAVTCLVAQTALAAITFDNKSSTYGNGDSETLTWSHTIGAGTNRLLVVGVGAEDTGGTASSDLVISSVKYNGVNMTLVAGSTAIVGSSTFRKTELYYLLDSNFPPLGTYSVTVTYSGDVNNRNGGAVSLAGVAQRAPEAVSANSNIDQQSISTNITTLTDGAWVVDTVMSSNSGSFTATGSNMTERWDVSASDSSAAGCTRPVATASQATLSWQHTSTDYMRLAHSLAAFAKAEESNCPLGDLNCDYIVDWNDLDLFADQWLDGGCSGPGCADLDGANGVNFVDYALLVGNWTGPLPAGKPVINEIMASNSTTIADEQGQYDDWIEIYNDSPSAIDIGGMYVTDDLNEPNKWRIPTGYSGQTTISAHGYLLLWADDDEQDGPLHLSFKLSADGEAVGLFAADGNLIDSLEFGAQVGNISYGCYPDSTENWRYMGFPTPEAQNSDGWLGLVDEVEISHVHGFYDSNFVVELFCDDDEATIKYTLDGNTPSDTVGTVYNPNTRINITTTTCLRAAAFKPGWKSFTVNTATYIFLNDVKTQSDSNAYARGFPVLWQDQYGGTNQGDYAMDPEIVNDPCYSPLFRKALTCLPTVSLVSDMKDWFDPQTGIYWNPWTDWERPVSLEFFDPCTGEDFQINAGIKMVGEDSQNPKNPQHSLRVHFRSEYGAAMLDFPLFKGTTVRKFGNLSLRAPYHWNWLDPGNMTRGQFIRDTFAQDSIRDMGWLSPYSRFAHVYINGLYWGLYQLSERPDQFFLSENMGGNPDDYDVVKGRWNGSEGYAEYTSGEPNCWDYLWAMFSDNDINHPVDSTEYAVIEQYLDTTKLCDYIIYNCFVCNWDWNAKNWVVGSTRNPTNFNGPPATKWVVYPWDSDISMMADFFFPEWGPGFVGYYNWGPGRIHNALHNNPTYNRLLGDRVHRHLFNNGALTPQRNIDRYQAQATQIEDAVIGESARWGDYVRDHVDATKPVMTRNIHWARERDRMVNPAHGTDEGWLGPYFPTRTNVAIGQYRTNTFYPPDTRPAPSFSQNGGEIAAGGTVTVTGSGTIKYTTDGGEPIDFGTTIASGGSVTINSSLVLKARASFSGNWSALNEATFSVGPVKDKLRITEMMYHPLEPNDVNTEFVELKNIGTSALNLNLVKLTEGIHFTFSSMSLVAGDYVLVVQDVNGFVLKYGGGKNVAGTYTGALANDGERIRLEDAIGRTILDFKYSDNWGSVTDGEGFSLNFFDADANGEPNRWKDKANWCASKYVGGTPDIADTGLLKERSIAINELLAHQDAAPGDWIELKNTTASPINIGGWYLSDSDEDLLKYRIRTGTTLASGAYIVFSEDANFGSASSDPCKITGFALSEYGEAVYLTSADGNVLTGYREQEDFGCSENGVAFGRYLKSTGTYNFVAMSSNTPGSANAYPKVGPVVINEIHYNPASGGQNEEYIELRNITGAKVNLYEDVNGTIVPWEFTDGIDFVFPADANIPANGYLLAANTTPAYFRTKYPSVPGSVQVLGPYGGKLSNSGETVEISKPGHKDEVGYQYYIRVDRVVYSDGSHPEDCPEGVDLWPTAADGGGKSLSRITPANYGNDPNNWKAGTPSPGVVNP
jgi:hypothetical protein